MEIRVSDVEKLYFRLILDPKNYPEVALEVKALSLDMLDRIGELCNYSQIQLMMHPILFAEQVSDRLIAGDYDIRLPQKYIEEFANKYQIPHLDFPPLLNAYVRGDNEDIYLQLDSHFNNN